MRKFSFSLEKLLFVRRVEEEQARVELQRARVEVEKEEQNLKRMQERLHEAKENMQKIVVTTKNLHQYTYLESVREQILQQKDQLIRVNNLLALKRKFWIQKEKKKENP